MARELCEKAVALDPNYAPAYANLGWSHLHDFMYYRPAKPQESYQKALDMASKALALDPSLSNANGLLGKTLLFGGKHYQAMDQYKEGLKANPNDADLLAWLAELHIWMGQPEKTIPRIKQAMRLNPYHPNWYVWILGSGQFWSHDYEGAIETFRKMSPMGAARRILAASLAYLGRMEEARAEAEKFMKENPTFSASDWASRAPFLRERDRQHAVEGFVKAGIPR